MIESFRLKPTFVWLCLLCAPICASDLRFNESHRQWTDSTGEHSTTAMLVSYENRRVTLKTDSGRSVTLSVDRLSDTDRVYLGRRIRLARSRVAREAKAGVLAEQTTSVQPRPRFREPSSGEDSVQMYGVDWYESEEASRLAMAENKPIMWFRVLGDLSGFM